MSKNSLENIINEKGILIHKIKGDSMMPMLDETKDLVVVEKLKQPLKKNDLPLYKRDNGDYILHRIIKIKKDYCITCGDNRWRSEKVSYSQILGVTTGFYKDGEYVSGNDKSYIQYVKNVTEKRFSRMIAYYCSRVFKRKKAKVPTKEIPKEFYALLTLYKCALTGECVKIDNDVNFEKVFKLSVFHSITAVCFSALTHYRDLIDDEIYSLWNKKAMEVKRRHILFDNERREIYDFLNERSIKYIPLKGILIKDYYPIPMTREFADNDIYFEVDRQNEVMSFMKERGYIAKTLSDVHDSYYKEPLYNFEFHKTLFDENHVYGNVFDNPLSLASNISKSEYQFSNEYFLAYFIAHFSKHFYGSGSGIRYFGDYYLLKKGFDKTGFDENKFTNIIKTMGLSEFVSNVDMITNAIFNNSQFDDNLMQFVCSSGTYGTTQNGVKNGISKNGKLKYILSRVFVPYKTMKKRYTILNKCPILLPFFWIVRFIQFLFNKKQLRETIKGLR